MKNEIISNPICHIKTEDPQEIRTWISRVERDDQFRDIAAISHEQGAVCAVIAGGCQKTKEKLYIQFVMIITVAAGSLIDGRAVLMFPTTIEEASLANAIILGILNDITI
jgi:hypothetical protein